MRVISIACLITILLLAAFSSSQAATNLNSSRSNIYRLIYPSDVVSSSQATSILADLEAATKRSQEGINLEETVNQLLPKYGLQSQIKKTIIKPASAAGQLTTIIILSNPADEAQALAVADEGVPADKPKKGSTK